MNFLLFFIRRFLFRLRCLRWSCKSVLWRQSCTTTTSTSASCRRSSSREWVFVACPWSSNRCTTSLILKLIDKSFNRLFILATDKNLFLVLFRADSLSQSAHQSFVVWGLCILKFVKNQFFYHDCNPNSLRDKIRA